ncbi:MAG: DUF4923 family protein [Bacteroidaceae bacterium]|nr:DUF4923 family protein [Bacteroidaceae bacterium]
MKKVFVLAFVATCCFATNVAAQSGLSSLLSKAFGSNADSSKVESATNAVSNVLGSLLGNSLPVTDDMLVGTWSYTSVACVLSGDEALSNIGGALGSSKIEETLNGYLSRVGLKEGSCFFTFASDSSCVFKVAGKEIKGKYTFDANEKKLQLNFYSRLNMTADVAYNLNTLNIVFNADKLLSLVKSVTSKVAGSSKSGSKASSLLGGSSSALSSVSSILENYDGMMLGMKLKKQ